jgi:hypothetical protein
MGDGCADGIFLGLDSFVVLLFYISGLQESKGSLGIYTGLPSPVKGGGTSQHTLSSGQRTTRNETLTEFVIEDC